MAAVPLDSSDSGLLKVIVMEMMIANDMAAEESGRDDELAEMRADYCAQLGIQLIDV